MWFIKYFYEEPISIQLGTWLSVGDIVVNYGIILDSLSMVVIVPVGIVTLAVLIYALDYMRHDPNRNRFYIILSVFAIFMTILVISDNYLMMFIGWEFVGVVSYLLISFWNTRIAAMKSALSAILLNRMGDTLFVICLGSMLSLFHALDFDTIELLAPHIDTYILNLLAIMLLIAATAKSAQLGLHGWLLSAMEGVCIAKFNHNNQSIINNIKIYNNLRQVSNKNIKYMSSKKEIVLNNIRNINTFNKSIKIWVYDINTLKEIDNSPFNSKLECSLYLKINRTTISKYINNNNIYKYKYIFSDKELNNEYLINKSINPKVWEVVTGELLGDGHISKSNINKRLEFTFSSKILYYVNYLKFNVLKDICNDTKPTPWPKNNQTQYWFSSKNMPYISNLHNEWYKCINNSPEAGISDEVEYKYIKILPYNIKDIITPISLAHWVMGDGYYDNSLKTILLCTDNFTKNEVLLLINILNDKFNIKSNIKQRKYKNKYNKYIIHYRIKIDKIDLIKFINLIKPHMIPEMYYKCPTSSGIPT